MLKFDVVDKFGAKKATACGNAIDYVIDVDLVQGDKIRVFADSTNFIFIKLNQNDKQSLIYLPNRYLCFLVPNQKQIESCFDKETFLKQGTVISIREAGEDEVYSYRNLAFNALDMPTNKNVYPHAVANFVTREEPCLSCLKSALK